MTETTGIHKSVWCTAIFDLFVYVSYFEKAVIKICYWDFWLAFLVPGLVVRRNPQIPQTLPLPRPWIAEDLCPSKTYTWIANCVPQRNFQGRLQQMALFLLSGEILQEIQRLKSLPKTTKAPKSRLCCSIFMCSHRLVRDDIMSRSSLGWSDHQLDFEIFVRVTWPKRVIDELRSTASESFYY